jgi:hypothetical protein
MNRLVHKTEGVNRTQTMRFYPFVIMNLMVHLSVLTQ